VTKFPFVSMVIINHFEFLNNLLQFITVSFKNNLYFTLIFHLKNLIHSYCNFILLDDGWCVQLKHWMFQNIHSSIQEISSNKNRITFQ